MKVNIAVSFMLLVFLSGLCSIAFAAMPADLVLYFSFDGNTISGNEAKDLSNYGNNGTISGDPQVAKGYRGDALDFNGAPDSVEIVTSESIAKTIGEITMEAWVYPRVDGTAEIISRWDGVLNGITHFEARAGGNMRFCMRKEDDSKIVDFTTTSGGFALETWTHVAETYDGSMARIYFNGVEVSSQAGSGGMRENDNSKLWVGSMYATDRWFNGLIDEVCIWSRALSPDEIQKSIDGTLIAAAVAAKGKLTATWGELKADDHK